MSATETIGRFFPGTPGTRIVIEVEADAMDRATHDRARDILEAALAEAGHPAEQVWWSDATHRYMRVPFAPASALDRARRIVVDALRLPAREEPATW